MQTSELPPAHGSGGLGMLARPRTKRKGLAPAQRFAGVSREVERIVEVEMSNRDLDQNEAKRPFNRPLLVTWCTGVRRKRHATVM